MTFDDWWDTTKAAATPETFAGWERSCRQAWEAAEAAERERARTACRLAVNALKEWKREFPEAWALVDQLALNQCERALGPNV